MTLCVLCVISVCILLLVEHKNEAVDEAHKLPTIAESGESREVERSKLELDHGLGVPQVVTPVVQLSGGTSNNNSNSNNNNNNSPVKIKTDKEKMNFRWNARKDLCLLMESE